MLKQLLVSAALLGPTASSQASVLWSQDTLPGTALCPDGDISWFTDSQVGQVIRVRDFDQDCSVQNSERAEFNTPSSTNPLQNGGTYYVGWRTRYDGPVPSTWNTVMQFKCRCDQDQPIVMDIKDGNLVLENHQPPGEIVTVVWDHAVPLNTWFDFELKVHMATDSTGTIEVWFNGVKQTLKNGSQIYHGMTWGGDIQNDIHWGVYRRCSINGTATQYIQRPRIATTFSEAAPVPIGNGIDTSAIYQLQNEASGLVLNNQGRLTNGSPITQWQSISSDNLRWKFIPTSGGYYQINSVKSGLDAVVQSASTTQGAGIIQWSFGSAGNDQWKPVPNSDGSYTFYNLHSGLVLEDPGSSTSTSTQMDQWGANGGANQKWNLIKQ
jgi:hypothetical protein